MGGGRWWLNRGLTLRWTQVGLAATTGDRMDELLIPPLMVGLLDCFREPTEPADGVKTFLSVYADDEDDPQVVSQIESFVASMQRRGVLVSEDQEAAPAVASSFARASTHVNMLVDYARTSAYREVLARHCRDKVVLEIGAGSGTLACLAVRSGAKRVYAIEETEIIHVARRIAQANGVEDEIVFIPGNSATAELPERADVVYSEIIGSDPLAERVLPSLQDASERFLAPGGTMIPHHLSIRAVCIFSTPVYQEHYDYRQAKLRAEELGRTYALDLGPLVDAYRDEVEERAAAYRLTQRVGDPLLLEDWDQSTEILTDDQTIAEFDLVGDVRFSTAAAAIPGARVSANRSFDDVLHVPLAFEARRAGIHNAVAVSFEIRLDDELSLTNSPFGVQMPINWGGQLVRPVEEARVDRGVTITLEAVLDPAQRPTLSFRRT